MVGKRLNLVGFIKLDDDGQGSLGRRSGSTLVREATEDEEETVLTL